MRQGVGRRHLVRQDENRNCEDGDKIQTALRKKRLPERQGGHKHQRVWAAKEDEPCNSWSDSGERHL